MASSSHSTASPQQIGKAFVVQYYRILHEHPESLHRFFSSTSTFMHDDPMKTVIGTEAIAKRIEELSLKQRHVKIRQVDCHSTVGSSIVIQVCGEISSTAIVDPQTQPVMKRFVQTFVLTPANDSKQKYYVHNDIFRYQDSPTSFLSNDNNNTKTSIMNNNEATSSNTQSITTDSSTVIETPITPSTSSNIEFFDNTIVEKKDDKSETNISPMVNVTPPTTPVVEQETTQEKEETTKPKSYRDAIGKKVKTANSSTESQLVSSSSTTTTTIKSNKTTKQQKKASKSSGNNNRAARGHPQDGNDYYDDSWYYGNIEEGYLSTGYTDDQEVFVGNLSAQITEHEIHELFRPYGNLLLVRIGNTGSQVGAANFAFVVCQSIEMAQAVVADHEKFLNAHNVNIEAKKRRPFPHTFRPTYPTAASPASYQSTGYPSSFYNHSPYYEGIQMRGARRGGKGAAK